jgi:PAS domain-containing protein
MIWKPRSKRRESSENPEPDADVRLDWKSDALNIDRLIWDTAPLPMAALEGSDHILGYANPAFCRLVSKTEAELTGKPFVEAVPRKGCLALLDLVYRTGEVKIQIEPKETEAHSARWSYTMWPILDADDHPVGVLMQVTETTQFHQRAIAVNEQLLLSGVRQHELRETAEKLNAQLQLEIAERRRWSVPW